MPIRLRFNQRDRAALLSADAIGRIEASRVTLRRLIALGLVRVGTWQKRIEYTLTNEGRVWKKQIEEKEKWTS
jgi:hypothetical protein